MKKKHLKKVREFAADLPEISYQAITGYTFGYRDGVKSIVPIIQTVAVNHARRIKRAIKRGGEQAVVHYVAQVQKWINKNKQKPNENNE